MDSNKYYSYAMGMNDNILKLKDKGFQITEVDGDYEVIFDKSLANVWEDFIKENLEVEYWNEYLSDEEIIFNFHLKDGFKKYIVKDFDNDEVLKLCDELCECEFESIEKMIKDNSFYNRVYSSKKRRIATRCYLIKDNKIISIKYKNKANKTGYYDLPGGKIEVGESPVECAKRECNEETGVIVNNFNYSGNLIIEYPTRIFDFSVFISSDFDGKVINTEENDAVLIDIDELIKKEKKFACISMLEDKFRDDLLNCTNYKYKITIDDNENIISMEKLN